MTLQAMQPDSRQGLLARDTSSRSRALRRPPTRRARRYNLIASVLLQPGLSTKADLIFFAFNLD
jgi:hypothetical protein